MGSILDRYRARLDEGLITPDPAQAEAATRLDDLAIRLGKRKNGGWFSKAETVTGPLSLGWGLAAGNPC